MNIIDSIILSIIEGITEFLPLSSTAHLIAASSLLKLEENSFLLTFNIAIQLAPILALFFIFKDILKSSLEIYKKLFIAFFPTGVAGLFLFKHMQSLFIIDLTAIFMFITGVLFLIVEFFIKTSYFKTTDITSISYKQSIFIGIAQIFALIPGISRSGITILAGLGIGLKREVAMGFSFLLAIPTTFAASSYTVYKNHQDLDASNLLILAVGFIISFIVGYFAARFFLNFAKNKTLKPFGYYLIISSIIFYIWF